MIINPYNEILYNAAAEVYSLVWKDVYDMLVNLCLDFKLEKVSKLHV